MSGKGHFAWLTARPTKWWDQWWDARLPRQDHVTFTQGNLYILPTRAGWGFALALVVMLLASINEQISLGYALTFSLAGAALVSMHQAHANLRGLTLRLQALDSVHAGEALRLQIGFSNSESGRGRHGLRLLIGGASNGPLSVDVDVAARHDDTAELDCPAAQRGWLKLPRITIESTYPLGLFRVWAYWRPGSQVLIWPALDVQAPPLPEAPEPDPRSLPSTQRRSPSNAAFPEGLRDYRRGDSPRLIAWRKSSHALASGSGLVCREPAGAKSSELWLDWQHSEGLAGLNLEQRLSRLATWLIEAEQLGQAQSRPYGLRLPDMEIACAIGPSHLRQCLNALATCGTAAP